MVRYRWPFFVASYILGHLWGVKAQLSSLLAGHDCTHSFQKKSDFLHKLRGNFKNSEISQFQTTILQIFGNFLENSGQVKGHF